MRDRCFFVSLCKLPLAAFLDWTDIQERVCLGLVLLGLRLSPFLYRPSFFFTPACFLPFFHLFRITSCSSTENLILNLGQFRLYSVFKSGQMGLTNL